MRIDLPPGAYIPVFHWSKAKDAVLDAGPSFLRESLDNETPPVEAAVPRIATAVDAPKPLPEPAETKQQSVPGPGLRTWVAVALACGIVLAAIVYFIQAAQNRYAVADPFWAQTFSTQAGTLFCVPVMHADPQAVGSGGMADQPTLSGATLTQVDETMNRVALADAIALSRLVSALHPIRGQYSVKADKFTGLGDLRASPVVLIGAFDNNWTLRLTAPLRFYFEKNASTGMLYVRNREKKDFEDWKLDGRLENSHVTTDYAIVARFSDHTTDQPVVVAAGLGEYGILAAAELLSNAQYLRLLTDRLRLRGKEPNFEAVLSTQVINGNNVPPRVLAVHSW